MTATGDTEIETAIEIPQVIKYTPFTSVPENPFIALLHARLASLICWTRYTDQRRRRAPQEPWHRACSSPSMTAN